MLLAKIIELFTRRYEFMITFQELGAYYTQIGKMKSISLHFKTMCSMAAILRRVVSGCIERLPRFLDLVFELAV